MVQNISTKDTLLKQYMAISKVDPYFDASETSAVFLEAYYRNDTLTLKRIFDSRQDAIMQREANKYDSCIHLSDLQYLQVDEAYRFLYWQAFCDNSLNITISRNDSLVKIHYVCFQGSNDKIPCALKSEFEKSLTIKDWEEFKKALVHADFWALKQNNEVWGYDGNGVTVLGFIQGNKPLNKIDKFHSAYRWWVEGTDLFNPFKTVVKLSGKNLGCP
jgi:hypothetical protein